MNREYIFFEAGILLPVDNAMSNFIFDFSTSDNTTMINNCYHWDYKQMRLFEFTNTTDIESQVSDIMDCVGIAMCCRPIVKKLVADGTISIDSDNKQIIKILRNMAI